MKPSLQIIGFLILSCCFSLHAQEAVEAELLVHRGRIQIAPVEILNSPFRETNLSITPDGKYLYFMSLRGGQPWSRTFMTWQQDSVFDGDIWYSKKVDGKWTNPKCLPFGINTRNGEDEPNVSPNGRRIYYQSWTDMWGYTGGPYYQADYTNGKLGSPKGMGGGITSFFDRMHISATDGMTVSPDGRKMVVACGFGYESNMDLFFSKKTGNGWSFCKKLPVSTEGNERSVFIAMDNRTLYFASDGYGGFGGLDIFKTTINSEGKLGEVINLGEPFNTSGDDYGFILTGNGDEGYFVRDGDIYFADLRYADERLKPSHDVALSGTVRDSLTNIGLQATVTLFDARSKRVVKRLETDKKGRYQISLPNKAITYDMIVSRRNYSKKRRRLRVPQTDFNQAYESNFFLGNSTPSIAASDPSPPPKPKVEAPKTKKPRISAFEGIDPNKTTRGDKITSPLDKARDVSIEKTEDPYSFEGVAKNNLVLLIDVSASMKHTSRLPLLKDAFKFLASHMRKDDRLSIITYASNTQIIVDGVPATNGNQLSQALDQLSAFGGTNSKQGMKKAYKLALDHYIPSGNNRLILATDGYFNIEELSRLAGKNDEKITLSIFSFGKIGGSQVTAFDKLAKTGKGFHTNITTDNINKALLREVKAIHTP